MRRVFEFLPLRSQALPAPCGVGAFCLLARVRVLSPAASKFAALAVENPASLARVRVKTKLHKTNDLQVRLKTLLKSSTILKSRPFLRLKIRRARIGFGDGVRLENDMRG